MPTGNRIISESYHVPIHNSIVTIETVEEFLFDDTYCYRTIVHWQNDADEDVTFESHTLESALQRHERLCSCFRKYQWFWKPVMKDVHHNLLLSAAV